MGRDRKDALEPVAEIERVSQEMDNLLLTTKRLVQEMQALFDRTKELVAHHVETSKSIKKKRRK